MGVKVREKPKGSGEWWIFIDHQSKRKSKMIGKDKRLAQEVAKKIAARLLLGEVGIIDGNQSPIFAKYAKQWIEIHVPVKCKPNTIKDYRSILERYILPYFGEKLITDINRLMVKNFLMNKIKEGHSQHIVDKIKVIIGNVINLALDDGLLTSNPTHRLGNIYGKKKLNMEKDSVIDTLTRKELSLFLQIFQEHFPKHYPLALTLVRTGMRLGEATALKWGDIDFNGRFITVQRSYSSGKYLSTPKNSKSRRVDMSLQLTETLWMLKRESERILNDNMPEWIFHNQAGNLMNARNWRSRVFNKALDKAELRHIRIHDLRHTFASLLLQAGESMMYVRDQLGHSGIKVTVDIYGHLVPGGNKEAVDKLDDSPNSTTIRTLSAPRKKKDLSIIA